ncbi:MAG: hypothetical protein QOF45_233 [Gaiellaceae bacterium]|jgi:hypothetical protein|nr:hypothetical protein [Gaiellaceae bacterium]
MSPIAFRAAVLVSIAVALLPAPASARPPSTPKPQEPREVQRLFESGGGARILAERIASVEEVAAVAAAVEGLAASAAMSRVTGVEPEAAASIAAAVTCYWVEYSFSRGVFPYHRWIVGQTYWCFHYGGEITYRSSNTSARVDGVCSGSNARDWRVGGGAGFSWAVVHHEADFSCATPWWYRLNDTLWMEATFDSYGNAWLSRTA